MIDIQGFKNVPGDLSVHPEIRARARREGAKQGYTYEPDNSLGGFERGAFPSDEAYRETYNLPNNRGNKIDTSSNSNEKMSEINLPREGFGIPNYNRWGRGGRRNFGGGFRERDMVDLELDRGGRTSAFIPVGQHRDSPHLGYTNDFASDPRGRGGARFLDFYAGGGLSNKTENQGSPQVVSTPHNVFNPTISFNPTFNPTFNPNVSNQNSNTFNPTNVNTNTPTFNPTFNPTSTSNFNPTNTSNPTFNPTNTGPTTQLAGGDLTGDMTTPTTVTPTTTPTVSVTPTNETITTPTTENVTTPTVETTTTPTVENDFLNDYVAETENVTTPTTEGGDVVTTTPITGPTTPVTPTPVTPTPVTPTPVTPTPVTPTPVTPTPVTPTPVTPTPVTPTPVTPTPVTPTPVTPTPVTPTPVTPTPVTPTPVTPTPPPAFSSEFATEQDAMDYVNQYYQTNLGRDANFDSQYSDASTNASYWINQLATGAEDKASISSNIDLSNEAFLNQQYNALLNRDAGQEGRDYWLGQMDAGQTRDQVIANIKASDEYKGLQTPPPAVTPTVPTPTPVTPTPVTPTPVTPTPVTPTPVTPSYGGGTAETNYITNQAAYDAAQAESAANITHSSTASSDADEYLNAYANLTESADQTAAETVAQTNAITDATTQAAVQNQQTNAVDDWLSNFYAEHGINQGKVDQGGRDYWTSQLAGKSKAEVERDILYAAANA